MLKKKGDIALIGLAVMGQNLILNMNDHGFSVVAFNRTVSKVTEFLNNEAKNTNVIGAASMEDMVSKLKKPRRVMLLVKAGSAVDSFIDSLVPLLEKGDIIIDGGNSEYRDSIRRCQALKAKGIYFIGSGVSGGEEGARYGPSLMPGGAEEAWPAVKEIFQAISAKADKEPCCDWVGLTLIFKLYFVFDEWNKGELESFLIEITRDIMQYNDTDGKPLVEKIRDSAGQKGTGKWTAIASLEYGVPVTLIGEAVFSRCLSSLKEERVAASKQISGPSETKYKGDVKAFVNDIKNALYASKIVSYAQGFMLMRETAKELGWKLNFGSIALMWRGGCIIRSVFLGNIKQAYDKNPQLSNLLIDDFFKNEIQKCQDSWRRVVSTAVLLGIPTPAFSTALAFFDGYRSQNLPANLIQAQRDYFGAHTYERNDSPGQYIHTNWTGRGGNVSSSTYQA
uniref:6-phosphogluconate dehydrogenase, decarboxylating n=1 Tax=Biomphalaria glabrata TaxID=6526 RepID=A0A2C9JGJ8_BIOGL